MNSQHNRIAVLLLGCVIGASLAACSHDLPTGEADPPGAEPLQPAAPAQVVPSNDDFDAAVVVPSLPFTHTVNTSEATPAEDDPLDCISNGFSVWYRFTPSGDTRITANSIGSDYGTGISVYTGIREELTQVACAETRVTFDARAGVTYYFEVVGSSIVGGNLVFNVLVPPPPLELVLSIDRVGRVDPSTGIATITGTVSCSRPVRTELLVGPVEQRIGGVHTQGFGSRTYLVECDGVADWEGTVAAVGGSFRAGPLKVDHVAVRAEDDVTGEVVVVLAKATVHLKL